MVRVVIKRDLKEFFPKEFSSRRLIGQFLDYVMNHFFQTSNEIEINGYIGKKTVAMQQGDYYIEEPSAERQNYQLSQALITTKNNEIDSIVDYCNFINTLKLQGIDVNDISRIVDGKYWSWAPLINLDMFVNYNYYYWVEEGTTIVDINNETNINNEIIGKENYTYEYYEKVDEDEELKQIPFTSGMRIRINNDINTEYNGNVYIVEGVGSSIQLVNDNDATNTQTIPDYFVMDRGCKDGNKWSKRNRWFHRSVVANGDSSISMKQAKKPIICFNKDIELYNHGTFNRGDVDFIYYGKKSDIHGKSFTSLFQGQRELENGDKILIIGDTIAENNNRIYEVSGKDTIKTIILQPIFNGLSPDGDPVVNEGVYVLCGTYANKHFYFNGDEWVEGQQKEKVNQSPLFKLFDINGVELDNRLMYNQSNFAGNKLFDYKSTDDENAIIDTDLNRRVLTKGYGNYTFDNVLNSEKYTYVSYDNKVEEIKGYKFVRINGTDKLLNDWHLSLDTNTQYVATEFKINAIVYETEKVEENGFEIDSRFIPIELAYEPEKSIVRKSVMVYLNGNLLNEITDYTVDGKVLKIFDTVGLKIEDYLYVKLLVNKIDGTIANGYFFDLPLSLTANPLNRDITEIHYNECFDQLTSIISNQVGFFGNSSGDNNYNDTKKDLSLGTEIIQHSRQLLKTMFLNSKDDTNIRNATSYVSSEYTKFKTKIRNVIETMSKTNEYEEFEYVQKIQDGQIVQVYQETNPYNIVVKTLEKINVGKEGLNPFYNNGVCESIGECYIPATPAYLGLDNCYKPRITTVEETPVGNMVLLCHDGSYQMLFNDYRDNALLEFENQLYNSISDKFLERPSFNKYTIIPGKFRETDYSYEEYINILTPFFEKWCNENDYQYMDNDRYVVTDQFTWNYSTCVDKDGLPMRGSYKAIYLYYYDTYRPHTHPWEMLGFGDKPEWWEEKYGKAPYTSSNIPMWRDIENGYIADGIDKGYHKEFERKGLIEKYLPVDEMGELLTPFKAGIIEKNPIAYYASQDWQSGDMGLVETMWHYTSDYRYALQIALYLMKPIEWVEENWETVGREYLFKGTDYEQLIYADTLDRTTNEETYMHNELINDVYIRKIGAQQWISDYLIKQNLDVTDYLGNPYRSIDIRLFYRCGGFYKKGTLNIQSDNFGVIPDNNYHLNIYKSITPNIIAYSAMIISKTSKGYMLDGYNSTEPYFMVVEPEKNGKKTSVEINGKNVTFYNQWKKKLRKVKYKTVFSSVQELFDIICGYGKYLEDYVGIEFLTINEDGLIVNYELKAEDFLRWTSVNPTDGQLIILNPAAAEVRVHHKASMDVVGKRLNGSWTILGTSRKPIYNDGIDVYRHQGYTDIYTKGTIMTMMRLNCVEFEHSILFDNETIYGDVLYDSLLCIKAQRFKLNGVRAKNWDGTLFAPGYLVLNDGCISNFDKLADDFTCIYDTDDIRTFGDYRDMAMQTIGYRKSTVMRNLLLNERNMFDFYKGLLKEKGTKRAFGKLNRSNYIMTSNDSKIDLYDNWAFKIADFGYTTNSSMIELNIPSEEITQNPQIISYSTTNNENNNPSIININWDDKNWLKKIDDKISNHFEYGRKIMNPTGGFLQYDDVDYVLPDMDSFEINKDNMKDGETVWVVKANAFDWNVYKKLDNDQYVSMRVDNISKLDKFNEEYLENGDLIFVTKDNIEQAFMLDNTKEIYDNRNHKFPILEASDNIMKDSRNIVDRNGWSIWKYIDGKYHLYRVQQEIIDMSKLNKCYIINNDTSGTLATIQLYDPMQNIVPNDVLDEIDYITAYDPVSDYSDFYQWGDLKVGQLWWDISKVRYLDYHQGDINYKRDNWGKQLPGSEIAIMEWVKTSYLPSEVTQYVHKEIWNTQTLTNDHYYYYWVKNPVEIPDVSFRTKSALTISNTINEPTSQGIIWLSPIDYNSNEESSTFVIANFDDVTTGADFVIQMNFKENKDLNNHTEWLMVREGDDDEIPTMLWSKMKDSLLGMDSIGQIVPDPSLNDRNKLGILLRPRQTMFNDMVLARHNFVDICNQIFLSRDVLRTTDIDKNEFRAIFYDNDTIPECDYTVQTHYELMNINDYSLIGKTIYVETDEEYDNIWTVWEMKGFKNFELKAYQRYNTTKYWNYEDLYQDNTTYLIQPERTFNSEYEMIEYLRNNLVLKNTYFKYYNYSGKWSLVKFVGMDGTSPLVNVVGIEDGAIVLNDKCYSFFNDDKIFNDETIFIDGLTKYEYLVQESRIVIENILKYFETKL